MSNKIAKSIVDHPDKDELLSKLLSGVSIQEIHEWLGAKYCNPNEKKFIISEKNLSTFQKNYLDIYNIVRDDLAKTKSNLSVEDELKLSIQGNPSYHKALEQYVNSEVDIKVIVKRVVAAIEMRASQVFDQIQEDPRNIKIDRTLIEWFNTLTTILEKYDTILNGNPEQINIQNNISIQLVDEHINVVYNVIKDILSKLDYDTSLMFIDMFNEEMKKLKQKTETILPQEERLAEAKIINETISDKLGQ